MKKSFCLLDDTKLKREMSNFSWLFCEIISMKFNGMGGNNMQGCVIMSRLLWPLAIIEGETKMKRHELETEDEEKPVGEENRMKYYISWMKR